MKLGMKKDMKRDMKKEMCIKKEIDIKNETEK